MPFLTMEAFIYNENHKIAKKNSASVHKKIKSEGSFSTRIKIGDFEFEFFYMNAAGYPKFDSPHDHCYYDMFCKPYSYDPKQLKGGKLKLYKESSFNKFISRMIAIEQNKRK